MRYYYCSLSSCAIALHIFIGMCHYHSPNIFLICCCFLIPPCHATIVTPCHPCGLAPSIWFYPYLCFCANEGKETWSLKLKNFQGELLYFFFVLFFFFSFCMYVCMCFMNMYVFGFFWLYVFCMLIVLSLLFVYKVYYSHFIVLALLHFLNMKIGEKMKYFAIVNICKCFDYIFIAYIC